MHMLEIPSLDPGLAAALEEVIALKQYSEKSKFNWSSDILPKLIERLVVIQEISSKANENHNKGPRGVDIPLEIKKKNEKIIDQLKRVFLDKPPFTIQRIAEIVICPEKEGYVLSSKAQVLKYFNSLCKLVVVATSCSDYPEVSFLSHVPEGPKTGNTPTKQTAQTIPLVQIPWLKPASDRQGNSSDTTNLDPMLISPPPGKNKQGEVRKDPESNTIKDTSIQELSKSPSRRRREKDANEAYSEAVQEYVAKRARTDKLSPCQPRRTEMDENEMDISNSTLEEITTNSSPISEKNNLDLSSHRNITAEESVLKSKDREIDDKMDISSENIIISDEEPLVY